MNLYVGLVGLLKLDSPEGCIGAFATGAMIAAVATDLIVGSPGVGPRSRRVDGVVLGIASGGPPSEVTSELRRSPAFVGFEVRGFSLATCASTLS
ncbi:hypothetical protein [Nocardia sp. NPDC050175]|uniref:hypothetical protein n=1 Tax=Nocardia sp. NPDC050175 TaxID=3364317 RepID=UPI00379BE58A